MLSADLAFGVEFARFCVQHQADPYQTALLISKARQAKREEEKRLSVPGQPENKHQATVATLAATIGFSIEWSNGLWPTLLKNADGGQYELPGCV